MEIKKFRPWAYWLVFTNWKLILWKKTRGPYSWYWDLPWWWIDFGENHFDALIRELNEEIWLINYESIKLMNIFDEVIMFEYNWEMINQHSLCIIYVVHTNQNFDDLHCEDDLWESIFINVEDYKNLKLTPITKQAIEFYILNYCNYEN